ncbi:hypothetical protein SNEBB_010320 [Seison nebaliae]|nr:hypothetical protein SNEBB_010320 [Seison nebaliae]
MIRIIFQLILFVHLSRSFKIVDVDKNTFYYSEVNEVKIYQFGNVKSMFLSSRMTLKEGYTLEWFKEPSARICAYRYPNEKIVNRFDSDQFPDVNCERYDRLEVDPFQLHHLGVYRAILDDGNKITQIFEFIWFTITDNEFQLSLDNSFFHPIIPNFQYRSKDHYQKRWRMNLNESKATYDVTKEQQNRLRKTIVKIHENLLEKLYFSCFFYLHCGSYPLSCYERFYQKFYLYANGPHEFMIVEDEKFSEDSAPYFPFLQLDMYTLRPMFLRKIGLLYNPIAYFPVNSTKPKKTEVKCEFSIFSVHWTKSLSNRNAKFKIDQTIQLEKINVRYEEEIQGIQIDEDLDEINENFGTMKFLNENRQLIDKVYLSSLVVDTSISSENYSTEILNRDEILHISNDYNILRVYTSQSEVVDREVPKVSGLRMMVLAWSPVLIVVTAALVAISVLTSIGNSEKEVEALTTYIVDDYLYTSKMEKLSNIVAIEAYRRESIKKAPEERETVRITEI